MGHKMLQAMISIFGACIQKRAAAGGPNHVGGAKFTWLVMGFRNMEKGGSIDIPHKCSICYGN